MSEKTLEGRTVVVTRPREQAGPLVEALRRQGAQVLTLPVIRIEMMEDRGELAEALRGLEGYDWMVLTSANGVRALEVMAQRAGLALPQGAPPRLAAIGPATAQALERAWRAPDIVPPDYIAEGLLRALTRAQDPLGRSYLLWRAAGARAVLAEGLRAAGGRVVELTVYRAVPEAPPQGPLMEALTRGQVDALTFTSPSTVAAFAAWGANILSQAKRTPLVVTIGPVTSAAVRQHLGVEPAAEGVTYDTAGLVRAVSEALEHIH